MKRILTRLPALLLVAIILLSGAQCADPSIPKPDSVAEKVEKTYTFLNPLGTIEPRRETPLADRSRVTNILYGTGTRTLRLGVTWYTKPLDGEPAIALGQMLKEKWEKESADPANTKIPAGLTVDLRLGQGDNYFSFPASPPSPNSIYAGLHPWNNKTDATYDSWERNADCIIVGVGD